jgi:hypothetical protein
VIKCASATAHFGCRRVCHPYVAVISLTFCSFLLRPASFYFRQAEGSGGAFYVSTDSTLEFTEVTFATGLVARSGGLIYIANNCSATMNGVAFSSSDAPDGAGALFIAHGSHLVASNTNFSLHQARGGGALVVHNSSSASFDGARFDFCSAYGGRPAESSGSEEYSVYTGGGVALVTLDSRLMLSDTKIAASSTEFNGGVSVSSLWF